ncbi:MAG: hypothetical protein AAGA03_19045, partial [Planctomycetota bacterium]
MSVESPLYFPQLTSTTMPSIDPDSIDTLAYVLAGVDPKVRKANPQRHRHLHDLAMDPSVPRVGPATSLQRDHQHVLVAAYDFSIRSFDDVWADAKHVSGGQQSTELLKRLKWLKRVELDADGSQLTTPNMKPKVAEVFRRAAHLQYHLFRSAVRHVEE